MGKLFINWEQIQENIEKINPDIFKKYQNIYGVPRGGLIPAVLISHQFGIPLTLEPGENTLIIDDICDTGGTIQNMVLDTLCLYKRSTSKLNPTYFIEEIYTEEWLVFPWEKHDSIEKQDYL